MAQAKLREQSVNCASLNACSPAVIPQSSGFDMIVAIGRQERYRGKSLQNLRASFWARETLQKLLKDEARGKQHLAYLDGLNERLHFLGRGRLVATKRQGPHTGIDEESQSRARSAL
jgi:hypothetical protein